MQITLKNRETISGAGTFYTPPVDVSSRALFTVNLTVHSSSGTSQTFDVQYQTCDNLEDWADLGGPTSQNAPGTALMGYKAGTEFYGRYVRCKITVGGTDPMYNYSLWMNTFASS